MRVTWLLYLTLLLSVAQPAQAERKAPTTADEAAARWHYDESLHRYGHGDFADALREVRTAQAIYPHAAWDFNLARCLERLEDWPGAADAYESYLRSAPKDAAPIRARIVVLRERARKLADVTAAAVEAEADAKAKMPTTPLAPTVPVEPATPVLIAATPTLIAAPPPPARPVWKRGWFWGALGAGAVVVAVGVGLAAGLSGSSSTTLHPTDGTYTVRFP